MILKNNDFMEAQGKKKLLKSYSANEERINVASHALGVLLSIVALPFLIVKGIQQGELVYVLSFLTYGLSLITLYTASTLFHHAQSNTTLRYRLNIFDHAAIFILIAGTYTPYSLLTLQGSLSWIIFGVIWGAALIGIVLKLFFTGRFKILSTIMYVLMGWVALFAFKPLYYNLGGDGFLWLMLGGAAYTIGAVLYSISKLKFNHAIFHVFVLIGSICHFVSIYFYV
jgi:hemolysin III